MTERDRLMRILNKINETEEACNKVQFTNMKYIIIKDSMLIIKQQLMKYLGEIEP